MSAGALGYMTGAFLMLLLIAMILVVLLRLIPPLKRRPVLPYGGSALLIVLFTVRSGMAQADTLLPMLLACALTLAMLAWDYRRTVKKARAQVQNTPPPRPSPSRLR